MAHSTAASLKRKAQPKFPLWQHPSGRWCKKIGQRFHYFGYVADDPTGAAALKQWSEQADDLRRGRKPQTTDPDGIRVGDLCGLYLVSKDRQLDAGEIKPRTRYDCKKICDWLVAELGRDRAVADLRPEDFESIRAKLVKRFGPPALAKAITLVRSVFRYGYESGHLERPVRFGPEFRKPSKKVMRLAKAAKGSCMMTPEELRKLIEGARVPMKAMLLLAINAAFGNHDVGTLTLSALDLENGFVNYARTKTGIARRAPLWQETVKALQAAIAKRPRPRLEAEKLVFVTGAGGPYASDDIFEQVGKAFRRLAIRVGVHRSDVGFYSIRHTFRTIADGAKDVGACRCIMGHTNGHVEADYIEQLPDDERLIAVTQFVHDWLYVKPATKAKAKAKRLRIVG